ncbi:casein kinase I-like [Condylostylus longicornis]|uniref:casein kinase I-like n=1 Tax=Condylostylus longicornis TaxID=2530218 RepID=UPI00244DADAE|nr:casein kinase I-like [Condylostylus longicornis]
MGVVLSAVDVDTNAKVAIKALDFPRLYYFGVHSAEYNILVMELLGPTLDQLFSYWGKGPVQFPYVTSVGVQIINRLEALHKQGYIHRDVKPDNFLIGLESETTKRYCDAKTGAHIPYAEKRSLTGTARYASLNAHKGVEPSRRDDLISAAYTLIYFASGLRLPWQGLKAATKEEKYAAITKKKSSTPIDTLCSGLPAFSNAISEVPIQGGSGVLAAPKRFMSRDWDTTLNKESRPVPAPTGEDARRSSSDDLLLSIALVIAAYQQIQLLLDQTCTC